MPASWRFDRGCLAPFATTAPEFAFAFFSRGASSPSTSIHSSSPSPHISASSSSSTSISASSSSSRCRFRFASISARSWIRLGSSPALVISDSFPTLARYPVVRSFSAISLIGALLLDRLWQHLFPALDGTLSLGDFDTGTSRCSEDAIRAANRCAQDAGPERAWNKLDRVICDAQMLYVLALRCPVRLAMIDKGSAGAVHYAAHAPSHLTLCLVYNRKDSWRTPGDAADLAQLQWDDLPLRTLLSVLRPLRNLTHLRAFIYCHRRSK
ncbi:hypothetical protein GSI_09854 [Ganoderma sinense ZZ0214-1]|uniref:Uncharacterized protein n=1 Tax=Ganoderma sinense ZZ0214-1 TaxID=1077348 RepID=A0A2G8S2J5_9APHY|nr:hypothetical protein GSI_09854 [Ganoderma sinense ZZ0214-1]